MEGRGAEGVGGWVRGNKPQGCYSSQEMAGGFLNSVSNISF